MNSFTAQLVLLEKCNLACKYCYMHNKNSYMTEDDLDFIFKNMHKVLNKYNCDTYQVSYFGGEPLLAWDIIKNKDYLFKNDPKCKFRVIISNG